MHYKVERKNDMHCLPYFPLNKPNFKTLILDLIFLSRLIGQSSVLDQKIPKAKFGPKIIPLISQYCIVISVE